MTDNSDAQPAREPVDIESMKDENGIYPEDIASMLSGAEPEELTLLRRVGRMRIEHSKYEAAWSWLQDMYNEHGGDDPLSNEGVSGLFHGPSGTGKSTVLRRFTKVMGGPFPTATADIRPVIRVATPANPNLVNIYEAMLIALGVSDMANGNAADMRQAVYAQLKGQETRLIIFDEFTHIVEDRSEKFATRAMRSLKELLNEIHCNVVFAGTDELQKLYKIYAQMRRRDAGAQPLLPFSWEDDGDQAEWVQLMGIIQGELLLKVSPSLDDEEMARKMHQASGGVMDHLMKLLFRATSYAFRDGADAIVPAHLSMAFERLRRGDEDAANPFGKSPARRVKPKIVYDDDEDDVSSLRKHKDRRDGKDDFTKR